MEQPESPGARPVAVVSLFVAAALAGLALWGLRAPEALPADAPPDVFSAERARRHLDWLAAVPRPTGSEAAERARRRLISELRSLGLAPEIQRETVSLARPDGAVFSRVENVLVRILGEQRGDAVLLVAHTDSVPQARGAGDDGLGTVTLLETLRALLTLPALSRDVFALFTDGEELGLLGAEAFVARHPAMRDVGVVLDFEARGTWGPAVMFETGPGSAGLVAALGATVRHPLAASVAAEVYRRMPNDTDFTVFRRRGLPGLNFAIQDGLASYHSPLDLPERLSPRSLQHQGEAALGLARRLAAGPLPERGEAVYFNPWRGRLVVYPASWALPLQVAVALVALAVLIVGVRRGAWSAGGLVAGAGVLVGAAVAGALAAEATWRALRLIPELTRVPHGLPHDADLAVATTLVAALGAGGVLLAWARRWVAPGALAASALPGLAALGVAVAILAPGASYLFTWTAAGSVLALALVAWRRSAVLDQVDVAALAGASLPWLFLVVPFFYLATVALTVQLAAGFGAIAVLVAAAALGAPIMLAVRRPSLLLAGALVAVVALGAAVAIRDRDRVARPRVDTLFWVRDVETETARWWSLDEATDAFTATWLGPNPKRQAVPAFFPGEREGWMAPAPAVFLPSPSAELLGVDRAGAEEGGGVEEQRVARLRLRLSSGRGAPNLRLVVSVEAVEGRGVEGRGAVVRALEVDGERAVLEKPSERAWLLATGLIAPAVTVEIAGEWQVVRLHLADQSWGLPAVDGVVPARPPGLIAAPSWWSDSTLVARDFRIADASPAAAEPAPPTPGAE